MSRDIVAAGPGPGGRILAGALVLVLCAPIGALLLSATPATLGAGARSAAFLPALLLSLRTSLLALAFLVLAGTPLAWWLARVDSRLTRAARLLVDLPIVVPPAVLGVALLQAFGRQGVVGPALASVGLAIPFTEAAVVLAQVVVAAPFYVQAAASAFARVDPDLLVVARTLGASRRHAFTTVAVPIAMPGLVAGASLAWARALGEFGATLVFAGNLEGRTRTLPLAIFTALESDVRVAVALSLLLVAGAAGLLLALRLLAARPGRLG